MNLQNPKCAHLNLLLFMPNEWSMKIHTKKKHNSQRSTKKNNNFCVKIFNDRKKRCTQISYSFNKINNSNRKNSPNFLELCSPCIFLFCFFCSIFGKTMNFWNRSPVSAGWREKRETRKMKFEKCVMCGIEKENIPFLDMSQRKQFWM